MEGFKLGAIKYLKNHHCKDDSDSGFNLLVIFSFKVRKFLNLVQCIGKFVCFVLLLYKFFCAF